MTLLLLFGGDEDGDFADLSSRFKVSVGEKINHLSRDNVSVAASPSADANFPLSYLYDYRCNKIFKFGSLGADPTITVDLNTLLNGALDAWSGGAPTTGWTVATTGTATVTETTTAGERISGSAAKLTAGNGLATIVQTYTARAGERWIVQVGLRGDATNLARAKLKNETTGKWWDGSAWVGSEAFFVTRADNTYLVHPEAVEVEDFDACQSDLVTLTLTLSSAAAAGIAYFDDVFAWPETDVMALLHHNVDPAVVPQWRHSTDNFSASDDLVQALTLGNKPSFYGGTGSGRRYQRLKLSGTNSARAGAIWAGELFLGQTETLLVQPVQGSREPTDFPQLSSGSTAGSRITYPLTLAEVAAYSWRFQALSRDDHDLLRRILHVRSMGGHHRALVVPDDTVGKVHLGSLTTSAWDAEQSRWGVYEVGADFAEEPGPIVVST